MKSIDSIQIYKVHSESLHGSSYREIEHQARRLYIEFAHKTKRMPYVRCPYFQNSKVFLTLFWDHLNQKHSTERKRRLKLYGCGLELLQKTHLAPTSKVNPNKSSEILHRFYGITTNGEVFCVQVRENKKGRKDMMSVFPYK